MKKLISLFLAVIMIFSLTACSDFPRSVEDLNESQVPDELKVSQKQTKEAGEAKLNLYYDMNLILACNYPGFNSDLDKFVIEEINNIRGSFIELVKEFKAKRFKKRGTLYVDYETFKKDSVISVVFYITTKNIDNETLNNTVRTIVYDTNTNKKLDANIYFKSSYLSFVNGIASEELTKNAKNQGVKDYEFSALKAFEKFAVKTDGVEFYFSKDDVFNGNSYHSFKVLEENIDKYVMFGKIDPNKPMVAITFDDGPGAYTPQVLDALEKYGVRATFFLVGNNLAQSKSDTLKRMVELGCELGSHTTDHTNLHNVSTEVGIKKITDVMDEIKDLTDGYECAVYRPPYGNYTKDIVNTLASQGKYAINWSIDTLDWKNRDVAWVTEQATTGITDGDIILMHDIHKTTVDSVEGIIKGLLDQGFQIITVSELMEQRGTVVVDKPVLACWK